MSKTLTYQWDALETPDPRFNHRASNWVRWQAGTVSNDSQQPGHNRSTEQLLGKDGRDTDIFMAVADTGYFQSPGELGFIVRPFDFVGSNLGGAACDLSDPNRTAEDAALLLEAIGDTLYMVGVAIAVAAVLGTAMGIGLYVTRRGGLFASRAAYTVLNVLVNLVRPIPFIIFITAIWPLTMVVVGKSIGTEAVIFPMSIMASFAFSRLVEQNLVALDPGVIEAARSMGASRLRIIRTVIIPETLGPLVLAFTFLFIGVTDMSAMAGLIGGGGLGDFAIRHGYQRFNWEVTFVSVAIIVVIVQLSQLVGNTVARRFLRR